MKKILLCVALATASLATAAPAMARDGCGGGWYRAWDGRCYPMGRAVVVDNRPGASGNIGTEAVVRAGGDGNTLLVSVNTLVMNRSLYPQLPFDPVRDLVPVSLTSAPSGWAAVAT